MSQTNNAINLTEAGVVSYDGAGNFSGSAITQHDILVAGASNSVTSISPSTSGYVLTSNGTTSDPSFQASSGGSAITTINGDTGSISGSIIKFTTDPLAVPGAGSSTSFQASGTTVTLSLSDLNSNTVLGAQAGNGSISGSLNCGYGLNCFNSLTSGSSNALFGAYSAINLLNGSDNAGIGISALGSLVSGSHNVGLGWNCLGDFLSGSFNIGVGSSAGINYTGSESNNICISSPGTTGDQNTTRLGSTQTSCYAAGIAGVTVSNINFVTIDTATGQLGSTTSGAGSVTITGDTGSISGSSVTIKAGTSTQNSGATVSFVNSGTTSILNVTDGSLNTLIGQGSGSATTTAGANTGLGFDSLLVITSGGTNVGIGAFSLAQLTTGTFNACLGFSSGSQYKTSESNNICIGAPGTTGDSGVIRHGTAGTHTSCFIAGITGVTVTGAAVLCSTSGQLGTISSSQKFKEDIQDIKSTVDLLSLRPVSFKYKDAEDKSHHYGLIAEEVHAIMPSLVVYDEEKKPYSIKYHEMPVLLLAEIKKLRVELDEFKLRFT